MNDELMAYADKAAEGFAADVEPLITEYRERMKQLAAVKAAALSESERIRREAEKEYEAAKAEAVGQCTAGIRAAANARAEESTRPEHLREACENYIRPLEVNGATLEPVEIVKMVARSEQWRREGEAAAARKQRRMNLVRGIG